MAKDNFDMEKQRFIKRVRLQPKTRQLSCGKVKTVPELRVNGNWLASHGFKPGSLVEITVRQDELIIKSL